VKVNLQGPIGMDNGAAVVAKPNSHSGQDCKLYADTATRLLVSHGRLPRRQIDPVCGTRFRWTSGVQDSAILVRPRGQPRNLRWTMGQGVHQLLVPAPSGRLAPVDEAGAAGSPGRPLVLTLILGIKQVSQAPRAESSPYLLGGRRPPSMCLSRQRLAPVGVVGCPLWVAGPRRHRSEATGHQWGKLTAKQKRRPAATTTAVHPAGCGSDFHPGMEVMRPRRPYFADRRDVPSELCPSRYLRQTQWTTRDRTGDTERETGEKAEEKGNHRGEGKRKGGKGAQGGGGKGTLEKDRQKKRDGGKGGKEGGGGRKKKGG